MARVNNNPDDSPVILVDFFFGKGPEVFFIDLGDLLDEEGEDCCD